jgi:hypothetical protein
MADAQESLEDQKTRIAAQIAELSGLLGMVPPEGTVDVHEPMTNKTMPLSQWLDTTRDSFLKLSVLIGKALDMPLQ